MKFIHTADLHLGSAFLSASFDREVAKTRREELFKGFEDLIKSAKAKKVDMLLVAGDLFEDEHMTLSDMKRVIDGFASIPQIKVVIVAGNHDYIHSKSFYNIMNFPSNVIIFKKDSIEKVEFPDINTCVYGFSFLKSQYSEDILDFENLNMDYSKTNILLLHCDIMTESNYLPVKKEKLIDAGFDYCALGHIHKGIRLSGDLVYPGSLEPLDFGETLAHGYVYGTLGEKKDSVNLMQFAKREFVRLKVDITGIDSLDEVINRLKHKAGKLIDKNLYRITLTGTLSEYLNIDDIKTKLNEDFYYTEIVDDTTPNLDIEKIYKENKENLIGKYIEALYEESKTNKLSREALYTGLKALIGQEAK